MINPLLTIIFDLFLIGSAASVVTAMLLEARASRGAAIGQHQSAYRARVTRNYAIVSRRSRRSARLRAA
ncbi:MAG: hypothetical protein ABIP13_07505 [Tepidiformaceae bacterium]